MSPKTLRLIGLALLSAGCMSQEAYLERSVARANVALAYVAEANYDMTLSSGSTRLIEGADVRRWLEERDIATDRLPAEYRTVVEGEDPIALHVNELIPGPDGRVDALFIPMGFTPDPFPIGPDPINPNPVCKKRGGLVVPANYGSVANECTGCQNCDCETCDDNLCFCVCEQGCGSCACPSCGGGVARGGG